MVKPPENPLAAPTALHLQLEIPAQKIIKTNAHPQQYYTIIPLDPHHLDVDPLYIQNQSKPQFTSANPVSETLKILLRKAIADCIIAHHQLLHLRSVAFDLIITEEGPVIIEANYNWGADMLYNVIHNDAAKSPHFAQRWLESIVLETE